MWQALIGFSIENLPLMAWILLASAIFLLGLFNSRQSILLSPQMRIFSIACVLLIAVAWNIRAYLPNTNIDNFIDLSFHFFGASLLVAMFGLWSAITLLFFIAILGVFTFSGDLVEASSHYVLVGALPALFSWVVIQGVNRFLPKHLFVLILGKGYLAGFMSVFASGMVISLAQQFLDLNSLASTDPLGWFLGLLTLSFMEGSLSGMVYAMLLVYRPNLVTTYNENDYMQA